MNEILLCFVGISVGGIGANRKAFAGNSLPHVDHIAATHSLEHMAYSKGLPEWGAHLAEDLERVVALHDASNIAAVVSNFFITLSTLLPQKSNPIFSLILFNRLLNLSLAVPVCSLLLWAT